MLNNFDLLQLPIKELSKSNTLIAVWVTNKLKHKEFVENSMFKLWGVEHWTQWHWLKVRYLGFNLLAYIVRRCHKAIILLVLFG